MVFSIVLTAGVSIWLYRPYQHGVFYELSDHDLYNWWEAERSVAVFPTVLPCRLSRTAIQLGKGSALNHGFDLNFSLPLIPFILRERQRGQPDRMKTA